MFEWDEVVSKAGPVGAALNADVIFYSGGIERDDAHEFLKLSKQRKKKRQNVLLVLVTPGGDAHAAYRIARCLQDSYQKFIVFVPGWCKSAGTLLAIGAHELIFGEFGELGPLDVQRGKQDELWETSSGLTEDAAMEELEKTAFKMFRDYLFGLKSLSRGQVTFGTAAEVAAKMVIGQLEPVYRQINPAKIGENVRAMNIAIDYGMRLNLHSENLSSRKSLTRLASAYSSHGFVLDRKEAEELFVTVNEPGNDLDALCEALGDEAHFPLTDDKAFVRYVNEEVANEAREFPIEGADIPAKDDGGSPSGTNGTPTDISGEVIQLRGS